MSQASTRAIIGVDSSIASPALLESLRRMNFETRTTEPSRCEFAGLSSLLLSSSDALSSQEMDFVHQGGHLWVFLADVLSNGSDSSLPAITRRFGESEWYIIPERQGWPTLGRTPSEFPAITPLSTLDLPDEHWQVVASVNIGMVHHPVIVAKSCGEGLVICSGIPLSSVQSPNTDLLSLFSALWRVRALSSPLATKEVGVAVVGYGPFGGMGYFHGSASNSTDGLSFVSAVDPDPARRKQAEDDFPGVQTFASVDELAKDLESELVIIATPPLTHFEIAKQLLSAGKHVVVEKPMCLTVAQADELIELATTRGRVLTVNQNRRWDQDFRTIRALVESGELGEVFNIETFVGGFEHPCRAWHSDESVSGGIAYDWGAHHIDWILQLYHETPVEIHTHGHKRKWMEVTNLDQIRIHMVFADGREATFFQSELAGVRKPKFYIQGTKATLVGEYRPIVSEDVAPNHGYVKTQFHHAEAPAELVLATYKGPQGVSITQVPLLAPDRFGLHRNLADHLHLGLPLEVDATEVREVIAVLEQSHAASASVTAFPPSE